MNLRHVIRNAHETDLPGLAPIELAAGGAFPRDRLPDPDATYPLAFLERALEEALLFVAEVTGTVVGFSTCLAVDTYLHLDEVSVHPDYGRRGIGRALTQRVIDESAMRGLAGVTLTTFSDFAWNAPFYRTLGFRETVDRPPHVVARLQQERRQGLQNRVGMILEH